MPFQGADLLADRGLGDFIYLRADVQGQSHQGFATGTVAFLDNGNAVSGGPFALNSEGNTSAIPT